MYIYIYRYRYNPASLIICTDMFSQVWYLNTHVCTHLFIYDYICILHIRTCADKYMLESVEERRKQVIISNVLILLIFSCNHKQFSCKEISKNNWTSSLSRFDFHTHSFDAYPTINSWVPQKRVTLSSHWLPQIHRRGTNPAGEECRAVGTLELCCGKGPPDRCRWDLGLFPPRKHGDVGHQNWGISQRLEQLEEKCFLGHQNLEVFRWGLRTSPANQQELCRFFSWDFANNSPGAAMEILGISASKIAVSSRWGFRTIVLRNK